MKLGSMQVFTGIIKQLIFKKTYGGHLVRLPAQSRPLLDLDLTLNLDHVTEGNMVSSFKYHKRRILSQIPWAVSQWA